MPNTLLMQLSRRDRIPDDERDLLLKSFVGEKVYSAGQDIVHEGGRPHFSLLLVEGFAGRHKVLADGARQITAVHVPGDFMDLHGFLLKVLAHGVFAMSDCRIAMIEHEALKRITETAPHLARMLWLDTLIDASVHREWLVAMGRRAAEAQTAHFICEMFVRLELVGLTDGYSFQLPITQVMLADTVGMSVVHVNRCLQTLRKTGALKWKGTNVQIVDWDRLVEIAEFDPTYLCIQNEPR